MSDVSKPDFESAITQDTKLDPGVVTIEGVTAAQRAHYLLDLVTLQQVAVGAAEYQHTIANSTMPDHISDSGEYHA